MYNNRILSIAECVPCAVVTTAETNGGNRDDWFGGGSDPARFVMHQRILSLV